MTQQQATEAGTQSLAHVLSTHFAGPAQSEDQTPGDWREWRRQRSKKTVQHDIHRNHPKSDLCYSLTAAILR